MTEQKTTPTFQNIRYESILSQLEKEEYLSVKALSDILKVSEVTIRKDLSYLEKKGYLFRTHGGASKKSHYTFERNVGQKSHINTEKKEAIAQKATTHINSNDSIMLASGTTMHHLAKALIHYENLTVLTASLHVSLELCNAPNVQVIQMGGDVRKSSTSVVGTFTETTLQQFSCSKLFLGIDGISTDFGISTSNLAEANLNQQMINHAEKIYVLGDCSKIGKRGFGKICDLEKIDYFITDSGITDKQINQLENVGVNIIIS